MTDKIKQNVEAIRLIITIISLLIAGALAFGNLDKRVAVLENQIIEREEFYEKMDKMRESIFRKIENETEKLEQKLTN